MRAERVDVRLVGDVRGVGAVVVVVPTGAADHRGRRRCGRRRRRRRERVAVDVVVGGRRVWSWCSACVVVVVVVAADAAGAPTPMTSALTVAVSAAPAPDLPARPAPSRIRCTPRHASPGPFCIWLAPGGPTVPRGAPVLRDAAGALSGRDPRPARSSDQGAAACAGRTGRPTPGGRPASGSGSRAARRPRASAASSAPDRRAAAAPTSSNALRSTSWSTSSCGGCRVDDDPSVGQQLRELLVPAMGLARRSRAARPRRPRPTRARASPGAGGRTGKCGQRESRDAQAVGTGEEPRDRLDRDDLGPPFGEELAEGVVEQQVGAMGILLALRRCRAVGVVMVSRSTASAR